MVELLIWLRLRKYLKWNLGDLSIIVYNRHGRKKRKSILVHWIRNWMKCIYISSNHFNEISISVVKLIKCSVSLNLHRIHEQYVSWACSWYKRILSASWNFHQQTHTHGPMSHTHTYTQNRHVALGTLFFSIFTLCTVMPNENTRFYESNWCSGQHNYVKCNFVFRLLAHPFDSTTCANCQLLNTQHHLNEINHSVILDNFVYAMRVAAFASVCMHSIV